MSDALWRLAGVKAECDDEVQSELAEQAALFLEAGGQLTLTEWSLLSASSRAAFTAAAQQVKAADALRATLAATPQGAAAMVTELDGGQAMTRKVLEDIAEAEHGRTRASHSPEIPPIIP